MTPTSEEWRPVPGYEGLYEVSDQGRVRSVDRIVRSHGNTLRRAASKVLASVSRPSDGRKAVNIWRDGEGGPKLVAHLVLEAFVGPRPPGMFGCHSDGDASNDRPSNLRWDTPRENNLDAVRHGANDNTRKTHCPRGHRLEVPNLAPSALARGVRLCLACNRAHGDVKYARRTGRPMPSFQELSDSHHARIVAHSE